MVTRKKTKKAAKKRTITEGNGGDLPILPPIENNGDGAGAETTGRYIVIFKPEAADSKTMASTLNQIAGLRDVASSSDYDEGAVSADDLESSKAVQFDKLGIVVCSGEEEVAALATTASDADSPILAIEPEYVAYLSQSAAGELPYEYLRGYREAVNQLCDGLFKGAAVEEAEISALFQDTAQFTWGLQATRTHTSQFSGQGIKLAVLDTGIDLQHQDFRGRSINSQSFVSGVTVQDVNGHGTHCIGTALGPRRPASGVRRYGVAFGAQIFAGKVFNNNPRPSAPTSSVIAGIEWAMTNGCRVVSLSLGAAINQKIMQYEVPVRRALNAGTLIVAAAGNNAQRPANLGFVEPPANADAAMAVGAVDNQLRIARFSARSSQLTGIGGLVNIAGPGVDVFSSLPTARGLHGSLSGTSMATPHVAGIAALWSQSTGESGVALWNRLLQNVRPLSLSSSDVGAGLVQAPQ